MAANLLNPTPNYGDSYDKAARIQELREPEKQLAGTLEWQARMGLAATRRIGLL
jgi:hypothetical protein